MHTVAPQIATSIDEVVEHMKTLGGEVVYVESGSIRFYTEMIGVVSAKLNQALVVYESLGLGPFPDPNFDNLLRDDKFLDRQILRVAKASGLDRKGPFTITDEAVLESIVLEGKKTFLDHQRRIRNSIDMNENEKRVLPIFVVVDGKIRMSFPALQYLLRDTIWFANTPERKTAWKEAQAFASAFKRFKEYTYANRKNRYLDEIRDQTRIFESAAELYKKYFH